MGDTVILFVQIVVGCCFIVFLKVIYDVVKSNYIHDVKVAKEKRAEAVRRVKSDYPKFFIDSEWKLRHSKTTYDLNEKSIHDATICHSSGLSAFMKFDLHCDDYLLVLDSTFNVLSDEERSVMLEYLEDLRNKLIKNFLDVELPSKRKKKFNELK